MTIISKQYLKKLEKWKHKNIVLTLKPCQVFL